MLTVAHLTLYDAGRRRIVTAAIVCAIGFLLVYGTGFFFVHRELVMEGQPLLQRRAVLAFLTIAGLYAVNFLSVLFAVLLPVDTLSGEIDSGVMQTIASKPIHRHDIVLGKWLGHAVLIAAYVLALALGVLALVRLIAGPLPLSPAAALPLMLLEMVLLMTVTIAGGTRLGTVTNGVAVLGFYGIAFVGGWMEQIGSIAGSHAARTVGVIASLLSPADALWRLGSYLLQPAVLRNAGAALFTTASVPTPLMVWWAAGFTLVALALAVRGFATRQL